jgi:hypothetical protein
MTKLAKSWVLEGPEIDTWIIRRLRIVDAAWFSANAASVELPGDDEGNREEGCAIDRTQAIDAIRRRDQDRPADLSITGEMVNGDPVLKALRSPIADRVQSRGGVNVLR